MSKKGSLTHQVKVNLESKFKPGVSRHELKASDSARDTITSYGTLETYIKQAVRFAQYARETFGAKTPEGLGEPGFVNAYIAYMKQNGWAASSQKTAVAAICKLLGTTSTDYEHTDTRHRADITRSRGDKPSDRNFSEANNEALVNFAQATGLRRSEGRELRPNHTVVIKGKEVVLNRLDRDENGRPVLRDVRGKGGRLRDVPFIGPHAEEAAARIASTPDGQKVWPNGIPVHMDVHSCRSRYATNFYLEIARDPATLPCKERYDCRKDRAGERFDRAALKVVSQALGHNRVSEIPQSYLRF